MKFLLVVVCALLLPSPIRAQDGPWALTNVAVVDVVNAALYEDQTIQVAGNRIVAVGPTGTLALPPGNRLVDASGGFAVPGLYDMHAHIQYDVHTQAEPSLEAALARRLDEGVVGIRDLGASLDSVLKYQSTSTADLMKWPRAWFAGHVLGGPRNTGLPYIITAADVGEPRRAVEDLKAAGVQFVKVHDWLSPLVYSEIVSHARDSSLPVVGHIPAALTAKDAAEAGQRSIEHLGGLTHGVLRSCSQAGAVGSMEVLRWAAENELSAYRLTMSSQYLKPLLDGFDPVRCSALARLFARKQVWQVPTLVLFRDWAENPRPDFDLAAEDQAARVQLFKTALRIVGIMHQAGVPILAGLDDNRVSLQDELELLVEAGLSPGEALCAATVNAAQFLGISDSSAGIAPGQLANFIVLQANPLIDIGNTRRINAVVLQGKYRSLAAGSAATVR